MQAMHSEEHKGFLQNVRADMIFIIMGFSAMVGQVLLLRRAIAVFGGNELVVGAVFFGWVFWAGLGNLITSYVADRVLNIPRLLSLILNLTAVVLPATVLIASTAKVWLGIPPSQITGLPVVVEVAIVVLAPFCFLVGASLTVAAKLPATGEARDIGAMYLFDALGAGIGGIVATWFAIKAFTAFQVALMTSIALIFFNAAILVRRISTQVLTGLIAVTAATTLWFSPGIEMWAAKHRWEGYNPIVDIDSRYGNLVVTEQREEHTLFVDGMPMFSTPLVETYEVDAILPLIMHPDPKSVLLIGGGLSGMLANWNAAFLDEITYVQVDPDVTKLERNVMIGPEAMQADGLTVVHQDVIAYLKGLDPGNCPEGCFDIIVLNGGDPDTAASSRLLTRSFFKQVRSMLKPQGVFMFGVFQPGNAIGPEAAKLLGTARATMGNIFEHLVILPFDRFYFIGSPSGEYLTDDPTALQERLTERHLVAPVLEGQYISSIFPERIKSMRETIEQASISAPQNTNVRPFAYFTGLLLWASRTGGAALSFLNGASKLSWQPMAFALLLIVAASVLFARRSSKFLIHTSAFWILFSVGFTAIIYEITLLVYYQLQNGLLFYHIGIIITAFMVGLSIGAYSSIRVFKLTRIKTVYLIVGLIIFSAYQPLLFAASKVSFVLANFVCGLIGGSLFEASAEWMVAKHEKIGHTAGWLGCADYWGSATGAILASIITIPIFGLVPTLVIAATLPLAAALVVTTSWILRGAG